MRRNDARTLAELFDFDLSALVSPDGRLFKPRFNIAPAQPVLTVVGAGEGGHFGAWKRWGLIPAWAKDKSIGNKLFNARAETVDTKPAFRSAFKARRCLVVADGFYEWTPRDRGHVPQWFHPSDGGLLAFAGLHEHWTSKETGEVFESATVITTEASGDLAGIHHRMPVILGIETGRRWLEPAAEVAVLRSLLVPAPNRTLTARIGRVGSTGSVAIRNASRRGNPDR